MDDPPHAPARQLVYDQASPEEQTRYVELLRTDPAAGMAYLDVLTLKQQPYGT